MNRTIKIITKSTKDYLAAFSTLFSPTIVKPTTLCDFSKYLATIPEPKSRLKAGCGLPNEMYNTSASLSYSQATCSGFSTINFSILSSSFSTQTSNKQSKQSHLRLTTLYRLQQDIYSLLQESCETSLLQAMSQHLLSEQSQANLLSLKSRSPYPLTQDVLSQYDSSSHLSALSELQQLKTQTSFNDDILREYINFFVSNSDIFFEKIASIKLSTGGIGVSIAFRASDNASQTYNIGNISAILYNSTNGSQLGAITFSTAGSDTGDGSRGHSVERARIDGHGRVGINTTRASSTLELAGTANITSGSTQFLVNSNGDVFINLKG